MSLIDRFGRKINYLRLSITDRCNLRCSYCMPSDGVVKRTHSEILRFEELYRIATIATELGIKKIRITGGEPLVRKGVVDFLRRLSTLPQLNELVLTTNGVMLSSMAEELYAAGVKRLNVSLDTFDEATFFRITRRGKLSDVLAGIEAARAIGLPVKINTVVMRGINDHEILDFIDKTLDSPESVRFIEYMPVIKAPDWQSLVMTGAEIMEHISQTYEIETVDSGHLCGPAKMYRVKGAAGTFGLITPLSGQFCAQCNRIRISADGHASSCLFSDDRINLRPALNHVSDSFLKTELLQMIGSKPARHHLSTTQASHIPFSMADIGG